METEKDTIKVGDFVLYEDRDIFRGTVMGIDGDNATIKVAMNLTDNKQIFGEMKVPITKLKKRRLV